MIGAFIFNEIESSDYNLVCKSVKRPLLPAVKIRRLDLPGISGVYDFDTEDVEYSMRPLTMKIQYIGTSYEELRSRARSIAAWLSTNSWAKLRIHDEDDKYYLAKVTGELNLTSLWESGTADINFDCQPFAYSVTEVSHSVDVTEPKNEKIIHPGTRHINYKSPSGSKFSIEVEGSWSSLSLGLNNKTLSYDAAGNGILILDNIEMECTLDSVNVFNNLDGDIDTFLKVIPGDNILAIGGTDLDATITVNFIPLWL